MLCIYFSYEYSKSEKNAYVNFGTDYNSQVLFSPPLISLKLPHISILRRTIPQDVLRLHHWGSRDPSIYNHKTKDGRTYQGAWRRRRMWCRKTGWRSRPKGGRRPASIECWERRGAVRTGDSGGCGRCSAQWAPAHMRGSDWRGYPLRSQTVPPHLPRRSAAVWRCSAGTNPPARRSQTGGDSEGGRMPVFGESSWLWRCDPWLLLWERSSVGVGNKERGVGEGMWRNSSSSLLGGRVEGLYYRWRAINLEKINKHWSETFKLKNILSFCTMNPYNSLSFKPSSKFCISIFFPSLRHWDGALTKYWKSRNSDCNRQN